MNIVIYARYSSASQTEQSIEGQLKACYEYAQREGHTVVGEYIDRACSGTTDQRPEFLQMIKDSKKKLFEAVLVYQLDRFSRNKYDTGNYKNQLSKNGVKVISSREMITDDPMGALLETMIEGYAVYYSQDLGVKVKRGIDISASKSKFCGGTVPLGFIISEEKDYCIDPDKAPYVVHIFEMYANGATIREIIDYLNENGVKNTKGNVFSRNSLNTVLRNEKYIGNYVHDGEVMQIKLPRIVSDELFYQVKARLEKNKRAPASKKAVFEYLLTGKLYCGDCGSLMVGVSGTSKTGNIYYYYSCNDARLKKECKRKNIRREELEERVFQVAKKQLNEHVIESVIAAIMKMQQNNEQALCLKSLKKELARAEKAVDNLYKLIEEDELVEDVLPRIKAKKETVKQLKERVAVEELRSNIIDEKQIRFFFHALQQADFTDEKYKKILIDAFVCKVVVEEDTLRIVFNVIPGGGAQPDAIIDLKGSNTASCSPPCEQPCRFRTFLTKCQNCTVVFVCLKPSVFNRFLAFLLFLRMRKTWTAFCKQYKNTRQTNRIKRFERICLVLRYAHLKKRCCICFSSDKQSKRLVLGSVM